MRRRLLLSYLSLVVLVLVVLEIPLGALADRHERSLLAGQAVEEGTALAIVAAQDLQHGGGGLASLVDRYHQAGGSEVLIVYASGTRAVDSDHDATSDRAELAKPLALAAGNRTATGELSDEHLPFAFAVLPLHLEGSDDSSATPVTGEVALFLPATATLQRIHDVWMLLGAFGVLVTLLTALIGARLAVGLARPLAALERSAGQLGAGDLTARAKVQGPREVRALAAEFNGMSEKVERLVKAQSEFVADASHQLRSPLAALRLRLENLESEVQGEVLASVEAAALEVQRLSRLVDGLLALTRAEDDHPQQVPVDVAAVIAERVEAWSALTDERGAQLIAGTIQEAVLINLVPGDLEQILDNYLANAVEATPPGRSITVEMGPSGPQLDIRICDEGIGMADADRERAFDRFWQGPNAVVGSSGIGLAIVRQLANRNQGTVALEAAVPGPTGVTAVLRLPYRPTSPPESKPTAPVAPREYAYPSGPALLLTRRIGRRPRRTHLMRRIKRYGRA